MRKIYYFLSTLFLSFLISFPSTNAQVSPNLHVEGNAMIEPGSDHLTISNIGSSGLDGVMIETTNSLELRAVDPTTADKVLTTCNPDSTSNSFFDVFFDISVESRLRLQRILGPPNVGLRMLMGENQAIEGMNNASGLGELRLRPNAALGGDHLVVSNIGSSGCDGVSMELGETVPTEIVALSFVGDPAAGGPMARLNLSNKSVETTTTGDEIMVLLRPAPGASVPAHRFIYDTDPINPEIRESGPPTTSYESGDLVTRYEYDAINRIVRTSATDNLIPANSVFFEYDTKPNPSNGMGTLRSGGNLEVIGNLSKGGGSFKIDHPLDPYNKYLYHSFVESPDMMNIYNGNIRTDEKGFAVVTMPSYFTALNKDFRYQLTVIGEFAQAIVKNKLDKDQFTIQTDKPLVEVSWQVTGVRQDVYANENRIDVEVEKEPEAKGKLLYQPNRIGYQLEGRQK